jgi:hypothetical protein
MDNLELLLSKYDFQKRQTPITQAVVNSIEEFIDFKLPDDYLFFLKNYNGDEAFIENEFAILWDADRLLQSNIEYEILKYLSSTIAIGGNGGGEFIGIERTELGTFNIVLSPLIGLEKINHIIIGDSFTDFLIRLDKKREWFE